MIIANAIMYPIDWFFPVDHEPDRESLFYAAKFVGAITTIALAVFVAVGAVTLSFATPFLLSTVVIFVGGMTNRPNIVYSGIAIAVLALIPDVFFVSIFDFPQTIWI